MMNYSKLLAYCLLICIFYSCAPKLSISEIELRINKKNTASFEGDVEYLLKNTPKKYLKEYGESLFREKLTKIYDNRKYPIGYSDIGELAIQDRNKCNSFYYYKVTYKVTKAQMTPYLDSTALKLNQDKYGKKNVIFNSNSKILHVTEDKNSILIFDKDRKWKVLNLDKKNLDKYYGGGFSKCLKISLVKSKS